MPHTDLGTRPVKSPHPHKANWCTMGGGGGRINKPKSARRKTKQKKQSAKASKKSSSSCDKDTTVDMLRQCRTNPKANVTLSGKKKRLLVKEARRTLAEKVKMEVDTAKTVDSGENGGQRGSDKMDTT